jgi:hypothetical protein
MTACQLYVAHYLFKCPYCILLPCCSCAERKHTIFSVYARVEGAVGVYCQPAPLNEHVVAVRSGTGRAAGLASLFKSTLMSETPGQCGVQPISQPTELNNVRVQAQHNNTGTCCYVAATDHEVAQPIPANNSPEQSLLFDAALSDVVKPIGQAMQLP